MNPDTTLHFAVIGDPIAHSKSPLMHNAAFRALGIDADYTAIHVTKDALPGFLERARRELNGFNVTVPHKNAVIPFLDGISDRAKLAGSVNTVSVREGKLYGDTTDPTGLERALLEVFGMPLKSAKVCILGCGGVVRALVYHLADAGCARLRILNRTADKAAKLVDEIRAHAPALDCGAAGMEIREYIYDMPRVMAAADLILCRAGASTLSELSYMGKPAILIPSPNVTNHHQEKNARVLERAGGAKVFLEGEFDAQTLLREIRTLLAEPERLAAMGKAMCALAQRDATDKICGEILALAMKG